MARSAPKSNHWVGYAILAAFLGAFAVAWNVRGMPRTLAALRFMFDLLPDVAAIFLALVLAAFATALLFLPEELKHLKERRKTRVTIAVILLAVGVVFGFGGVASNLVQRREEKTRTEADNVKLIELLQGSATIPMVMIGPCLPPTPNMCDVNLINRDKLAAYEVRLTVGPTFDAEDNNSEILSKIAAIQEFDIGTVDPGLNSTRYKLHVPENGANYNVNIRTKNAKGFQRIGLVWGPNHLLGNN